MMPIVPCMAMVTAMMKGEGGVDKPNDTIGVVMLIRNRVKFAGINQGGAGYVHNSRQMPRVPCMAVMTGGGC
jgi:hypothetical protein